MQFKIKILNNTTLRKYNCKVLDRNSKYFSSYSLRGTDTRHTCRYTVRVVKTSIVLHFSVPSKVLLTLAAGLVKTNIFF